MAKSRVIIRRKDLATLREKAIHAAQGFQDWGILWFEAWVSLAKSCDCLSAMMTRAGLSSFDWEMETEKVVGGSDGEEGSETADLSGPDPDGGCE